MTAQWARGGDSRIICFGNYVSVCIFFLSLHKEACLFHVCKENSQRQAGKWEGAIIMFHVQSEKLYRCNKSFIKGFGHFSWFVWVVKGCVQYRRPALYYCITYCDISLMFPMWTVTQHVWILHLIQLFHRIYGTVIPDKVLQDCSAHLVQTQLLYLS